MPRYLITGASGMLGHDLQRAMSGRDVTALGRTDLDVTDLAAVRAAVAGHDVVINAAAYTKVDDAESYEADDPISAYGRTKAAGERLALQAHPDGTYVLRTAWLYGADGPNFATTML